MSASSSILALLAVPSSERCHKLMQHLAPLKLRVVSVNTCREVRERLRELPRVDVVITEVSLLDGNWCDVLTSVVNQGVSAKVIVTSPLADERFWSEVLWRGVHDVLVEPYESLEVRRIVDGGLRASQNDGDVRKLAPFEKTNSKSARRPKL